MDESGPKAYASLIDSTIKVYSTDAPLIAGDEYGVVTRSNGDISGVTRRPALTGLTGVYPLDEFFQ